MSSKILIFYINQYSGHFRAAQAIEQTIKLNSPNVDVLTLDSFNYINPVASKIIYNSYLSLIRKTPEVWEYLYDNPNIVKKSQKFKELIHKYNSIKLNSLMKEYNPDVVVCTQAFPCGLVSNYKNSYLPDLPLVAVLTDYYPHSFWLYSNVDFYIVASEKARLRLVKEGISKEKIKIYGIPIVPEFLKADNRENLYSVYGLNQKKPIILIMGGSQGLGPIKKIVFYIDKLDLDFQVVVITGINNKLYKYLIKKRKSFSHQTNVFEYFDHIEKLMQITSILVTKPGGITTSEAIAKGLPMVIFNPIPGQEKNNAKFLLEKGMALKADTPEGTAVLVKELLINKDQYNHIKDTINKNKIIDSSLKITDLICSLTQN